MLNVPLKLVIYKIWSVLAKKGREDRLRERRRRVRGSTDEVKR
jgi:hypothetical protein